ncbi:hypothetical protein ABRY23_12575 [Melioribacteraceae bacterium 4301-Me]|uniref:hypothetical protein n=1 Tax=Pyranulibacter aquaticus TaxID=3163344 RepID=UPI00359A715E
MKIKYLCIILFSLYGSVLLAQTQEQILKYRTEPYGDKTYRKKGIMDGNLIRTIFRNDGQIGTWPDRPSGEWPKGTGHNYIDGCTPMTSSAVIAPGNHQLIHPCQTSYREEVDFDPVTNELWVMEPVPGYANPASEEPAISTKPRTWPLTWPRSLPNIDPSWDGYWFGYFGRGVQNADFETFYVIDDSKDKEFTRLPYLYYPIATDSNRGGLGLREEVRGFQWSHVLAEDIIFWHFDIVNMSDYDYDTTYFGFYCDTGVGGVDDNGDDCASFSTKLDIAYAFDKDGIAPPDRWKTGYVGYAYLESPGNGFNGIDDDEDGMVDERRDDGIDNDHDWVGFTDVNGNGKWDPELNEPLNDDLGKDGVGPFDPQYTGPDEGEGDGIPTDGEPNFDRTDKDESDQIGLTSLSIYRLSGKGPTDGWPKNDEVMWRKMAYHNFDTTLQNSNISMVFGSGPFPLKQYRRERFSVALVFGNDLSDMIFNKETVQAIYNANYNFSKPPYKPTLTAVAGDKKVFLYWDSKSENSYDNFLRKFDFEGYLIYKSEEPEFNDIKVITDSKGEPKYWKPIAQFDLKDGIKGPDPVGINGAHFWRGDDTGLQHSYIDTNVTNGKTYYYALVAYDQGDPNYGTAGLIPTETTKIIQQDLVGNIRFVDINCAVVRPNAPVAGYTPPNVEGELTKPAEGIGTGHLNVSILNPNEIKEGNSYKIVFKSVGDFPQYKTTGYSIIRTADGKTDTLQAFVDSTLIGSDKVSPPFDGLVLSVINDSVTIDAERTKFVQSISNLDMVVTADNSSPARDVKWPADFEIEFTGENLVYTTPFTKMQVPFKVTNLTTGQPADAEVFDNNKNKKFDLGDDIVIIQYVGTAYKLTWRIGYYRPTTTTVAIEPRAGDKFIVATKKPFKAGDYFTFATKAAKVDVSLAKNQLSRIAVVPNPYIAAASWEKRNINYTGRGERRLDFIHLPEKCTIRIYTVTGALVKTLYKDGGAQDGSISWNLVSEDGMDIAYGLYIYHVDAPGIGEYVGKFAVIK